MKKFLKIMIWFLSILMMISKQKTKNHLAKIEEPKGIKLAALSIFNIKFIKTKIRKKC